MTCHAGSQHAAAADRGCFGQLCDDCWSRVRRIVARLLGRAPP